MAYWGDLDNWGLNMLATAMQHLPHLKPLLMDRATFEAHQHLAVSEPAHAEAGSHACANMAALDDYLRKQERGRLEQEFLPECLVKQAAQAWAQQLAIP